MSKENPCGTCWNCCTGTMVRVREEDLLRWRKENRYDIILCLENYAQNSVFLIHKKENEECIFLTEDGCEIYDTRPVTCKRFPTSEEKRKKYDCKLPIQKFIKPRRS